MSGTHSSVLELIGKTPLVELTDFDIGRCRLFVKLENQNPGGSIKDRMAVSMIRAAESSGQLKPGGVIVEATAGNTGLGLALVASATNYKLIVVIPDKMSTARIQHLHGMGADVRITRTDVDKNHPQNYVNLARSIAEKTPNSWFVDQFSNPANPLAHEQTTGPEIWSQMDGKVDAIVCGVGSGGTITGLSRYFSRTSPETEMILADPAGSSLAEYVRTGQAWADGFVRRRRNRSERTAAGRRPYTSEARVHDYRRTQFRSCSRDAARCRDSCRFLERNTGRRGNRILP